jgi:hypothetical protein
MKKAWVDLKSFVTVAMVAILAIIVIADLLGANLTDNILILVTNLITAVFTYYFTKKESE